MVTTLLATTLALTTSVHVATVLSVGDGDTITVRKVDGSKAKIRLACIDAPESGQGAIGAAAKVKLKSLAPIGSSVGLRVMTTDRYGRLVADVLSKAGSVNQQMVASGNAFVYWDYVKQRPANLCSPKLYGELEREAKAKKLGVWAKADEEKPWEWRQRKRREKRWNCALIGAWYEAQRLLGQGHAYLDRDVDGEACENLALR